MTVLFLCPPHAKHQMGQACRLQQVRLPPSRQPKHLTSVVLTPSRHNPPPSHHTTYYTPHRRPQPSHCRQQLPHKQTGARDNYINLSRYKEAHQPDMIGHNFVSIICLLIQQNIIDYSRDKKLNNRIRSNNNSWTNPTGHCSITAESSTTEILNRIGSSTLLPQSLIKSM